jgi:uncharacterized protein (DUF488 family)
LEEFIALLQAYGVKQLVDVRTVPRSRANPQFNQETLAGELEAAGIRYRHMKALGGLRSRQRGVPESRNAAWENAPFHNFADYALSEEFGAALDELIEFGGAAPTAIMCAEAVWWRCHRRIITDYLLARSVPVRHIMSPTSAPGATLTPFAKKHRNGTVTYPVA